jgi:hypothetical protein
MENYHSRQRKFVLFGAEKEARPRQIMNEDIMGIMKERGMSQQDVAGGREVEIWGE